MTWFGRLVRSSDADDGALAVRWALSEATCFLEECDQVRRERDELRRERDGLADALAQQRRVTERTAVVAHEEGRAAGREEGHAEAGVAVQELRDAARRVARLESDVLERLEDELRELAVAIAGRIVRDELSSDPTRFADTVRAVLSAHSMGRSVEVLCHPDRLDVLRIAFDGEPMKVRVGTDRTLGPWDFELSTERCHLDGRLEAQLVEISRCLEDSPLDLVGAEAS